MSDDKNAYFEVTRPVAPRVHRFNPFISLDGARVGYHRCWGRGNGDSPLLLENIKSPGPADTFSLFRIDGSFPPSRTTARRSHLLRERLPDVVGLEEERRDIHTSIGPDFAIESTEVDVVAISLGDDDDKTISMKKLTVGDENNAFPSPPPDGKWLVFRSGRSGAQEPVHLQTPRTARPVASGG
uniref:Uncharacterized protein n=1 Tax=Oryza rufipogon TaxID=4529 RepID=A0A0E0P6P9_ORYRU